MSDLGVQSLFPTFVQLKGQDENSLIHNKIYIYDIQTTHNGIYSK
jgi:hypothetical protein